MLERLEQLLLALCSPGGQNVMDHTVLKIGFYCLKLLSSCLHCECTILYTGGPGIETSAHNNAVQRYILWVLA